ncbi:MAG: MFS transporter [Chloroflexota bacterium]|nr:MFS transporter [Chloroflexota bacterium]
MTGEAHAQPVGDSPAPPAAVASRGKPVPADAAAASQARWLLLTVAVGTTLAPLNSTMIAVALPDIQLAFGVSVTATAWLVTIYLVAMAVGQPIGGRLGDLYGRRRVYLFGLAWFAVASAGCAFAPSLPVLILFRTQQALAGALSFPNGGALIREGIPDERRGSAFGTISMAAWIAAASGPPVGGLLVHWFGWAAIFWANVPVVALAIVLGVRSLPRPAPAESGAKPQRERFDVLGSALFTASLAAVIVVPALVRLDRTVLAAVLVGAGLLIGLAFAIWELRSRAPVVDIRLFRRPEFAAACASVGMSNLVMYTTLLAMPLYLERVRGHDSRVTGLTLAALSALSALGGPLGGRWTDRRGRVVPAVTGAIALFTGAVALTAAAGNATLWPVAVALGGMGIGLGISGASVQAAAVESVPVRQAGSASGMFSTSRYLGSVIGSTALAIVFVNKPGPGASDRFVAVFAVLAIVALAGIVVNTRIGSRE